MQAEADVVPFETAKPFEMPREDLNVRKPLYLFFAGNTVDPKAARQRPHQRAGGIEVDNPCLNFSKSFLRRGRLSPLLMDKHLPVPREMLNPDSDNAEYFSIAGENTADRIVYVTEGLATKRAFPGQQINNILFGSSNQDSGVPRGIIEIESLRFKEYVPVMVETGIYFDKDIWDIQKAFFPDYPKLPVLLRDLRSLIETQRDSELLKPIREDMLMSCEQFEQWAGQTLERVHRTMRETAAQSGYVPAYTGVELVLLDQLGIPRQDEEFKRLAMQSTGLQAFAGPSTGELKEVMTMLLEANKEERQAFIQALNVVRGVPNEPEEKEEAPEAPFNPVLTEKPLHWKTREKLEREAAEKAETNQPTEGE